MTEVFFEFFELSRLAVYAVAAEVLMVITKCAPLSVAVGIVSGIRKTAIGYLYWPLKIASIVKSCFLPIEAPVTPLTGMVGDFTAYFLCSQVSLGILEEFLDMEFKNQRKYAQLHNFVLNFMWALEASFLVRGILLLIISVYDFLKGLNRSGS